MPIVLKIPRNINSYARRLLVYSRVFSPSGSVLKFYKFKLKLSSLPVQADSELEIEGQFKIVLHVLNIPNRRD